MKLKTGKLDNLERKFIPVRKSNLEKYLKTLTKVESYKITQFYRGDYKYRKFEDDKETKFTRSRKQDKITIVEEIDETQFNKNIGPRNYSKNKNKIFIRWL